MKYNKISRRMFLQGAGNTFVAIPFLTSLLPKELWAETPPVKINRFLTYVSREFDFGHHANWIPNNGSLEHIKTIPQPKNIIKGINGHHDIRQQALRDFAPTNSSYLCPIFKNTVSSYIDDMNIIRGLDFPTRFGHGREQTLGGISGSLKKIQTLDAFLNNHLGFNPKKLPLFTTQSTDEYSQMLQAGNIVNSAPTDVYFESMMNSMFQNQAWPEKGATSVGYKRSSTFNRVLEDYNRIRQGKNISKDDKIALDNIFDKFSDIQNNFVITATEQCEYKNLYSKNTSVTKSTNWRPHFAINDSLRGKAFADLISAAFMCDSIRVMTLVGGPFTGVLNENTWNHETSSHTPFAVVNNKLTWQIMGERQAVAVDNFIGPLLKNLSSAIDPHNGQSILHNSVVFQTAEASLTHGWMSVPVITYGQASGALKTGQYLDYSDRTKLPLVGADIGNKVIGHAEFNNNWPGVSYNRFFVTLLQAFGIKPEEYEDPSLNAQVYNRNDIGQTNIGLKNIGGFGYAFRDSDLATNSKSRAALANYDLNQFRFALQGLI